MIWKLPNKLKGDPRATKIAFETAYLMHPSWINTERAMALLNREYLEHGLMTDDFLSAFY